MRNRCSSTCWAIYEPDYALKVRRLTQLTAERRQHILQHPEMVEWVDKIGDALAHPEWVFVLDLTLD